MPDYTKRLIMFVPAAAQSDANTLMQSVTGQASDASTFARHETLAGTDYYYADMLMTTAQHGTFAAGEGDITGLLWYDVELQESGDLVASNDPGVDSLVGTVWRRWNEARQRVSSGLLSIDTTSLPAPSLGIAYSAPITIGGAGADSVTISAGALPTGLSITLTNSTTATISGTPTAPGSFDFTVEATYGSASVTHAYTLLVVFTPLSLANLMRWYERPTSAIFGAADGTGAVSADGVVGYLADLSGNAQHAVQATEGDKPLWRSADGVLGDCIDFVSSDRLTFPSPVSLTGDFTLFARFVVDSLAASRPIFGNSANNTNLVTLTTAGVIQILFNGGTNIVLTPAVAFATGTEYYILITRAGTSVQLWKNGTKDGTGTSSATLNLDQMGRRGSASDVFDGKQRSAGIITRALTDAECANLNTWLALGANYAGPTWYADPAADANSQGTTADPILASEVLAGAGGRLKSGHTVVMKDGTHVLTADTTLGVGGVLVQAENPLAATLDLTGADVANDYGDSSVQNNFYVSGAATRLEDLIIKSVPQTRVTPQRFTYPKGIGRLWIQGGASPTDGSGYASLKRCIIGNILDIASYVPNAGGVVAEDCIVYDNGWNATAEMDGEHFYTQNVQSSPDKIFRRLFLARCYGLGVQQYSETSNNIWDYVWEDITLLSEFYALAGVSRKNNTQRRLLAWKARISNGSGSSGNQLLTTVDSYVVGADLVVGASSNGTVVTGNTVVRLDSVGSMQIGNHTGGTLTVDNNHYYGSVVLKYNNIVKTWTEWQALGFDLNGSYSASLPTTNQTFVVAADANSIARGWYGQVTQFNWESDSTPDIDLTALGVTNGQQVKLYSIHDPLGDIRTVTASGTVVTTNLSTRTDSVPAGAGAALNPALDVRFHAWVVRTAA